MAEETRDVRTKLIVEKTGEQTAFADAAKDVEALGQSSDQLDPLAEAILRIVDAQKQLAGAEGAQATLAALKELESALESFGEVGAEGFERNEDAANKLAEALGETRSRIKDLEAPLVGTFEKAEAAVKRFDNAAEKGLRGAEKQATDARFALDRYQQELEEAARSGKDVGEAERANLARLEGQLESATKKWAQYKNAQEDVRDATKAAQLQTGEMVGSINSLDDIVGKMGPKWADLAGKVTGAVGAFTAGYAAGEKLREMLNSLTSGGFDRAIQGGTDWILKLVTIGEEEEEAARQADNFANGLKILRANGIDPAGLSAEQVAAKVDELGKKMQSASTEAAALNKKLEEFGKTTLASSPAVEKAAADLETFIRAYMNTESQMSSAQIGKVFEDQIRKIMEAAKRLGIELPDSFNILVESLGVVPAEIEKATKESEARVKALVQALTGVKAATVPVQQAAAEIVAAFGSLSEGQKIDLAKARSEVQQLVDRFRAAGRQIPDDLAAIAEKVGVVVGAMEVATKKVNSFGAAQSDLEQQLLQGGQVWTKTEEGWKKLATGAEAAAKSVGDASRGASDTAAAAAAAAPALDKMATAQEAAATGAQAGAAATSAQAAAINEGLQLIGSFAAQVTAMGQALQALAGVQFAGPVNAQLDAIGAKAVAVAAQLQALSSFSGGATGTASASP